MFGDAGVVETEELERKAIRGSGKSAVMFMNRRVVAGM